MNSACGSMKRRISHGQAMRSILGCSRVTHLPGAALTGRYVGKPFVDPVGDPALQVTCINAHGA